ncbi:MAG: SpoIIE family protein phosphatase [Clostridia bacterium]|nr:SpoIIE family protein phosphatase [Clostridia bacterium]
MNIEATKTQKAFLVPCLYFAGKVLLLAVLTRTQIIETRPFGIAYAAVLGEENIFAAVLGLILGVSGSMESAIKYILAAVIYGSMAYIRKLDKRQVKAVALGTAVALASLITLFKFGATPKRIAEIIPEMFAVGGLYLLFGNIKERNRLAYAAEMIIFGAVMCGTYGLKLPYLNINIPVFAAMMIAMSVSYSCDIPIAVLTGLGLGFMTFLNQPEAVEMSGLFAVSALIASITAKTGKAGVAAGFLSGATICVLCIGSLGELSVADIFAAPIIFLIIPQSIVEKVGSHINEKFADRQYATEIADRIKNVAIAVEDLGNGVRLLEKGKESEFYYVITERVCKDCKNAEMCRISKGEGPIQNIKEMNFLIERDGFLNASNLPQRFWHSCVRAERFLGEFLHMYEIEKQSEILKGELAFDRELVAKQYGEVSNIISTLTERKEAETGKINYDVSVSVCQEAKNGQEVNGDTVIHFKSCNKYYVILCDGMGSGVAAREISGLTARLFAEFFESGIEKSVAVDMINSAIALNADRESFSSADILEIDVCSGEAEFLKIGSAQSFMKRDNEVEEVSSSALPVGILERISVKPQKYKFSAGDEILMITDGIGEAGNGVLKNEWIKKIFVSSKGNCEERARQILDGAKARTVFSDDMTVVIIRLKYAE